MKVISKQNNSKKKISAGMAFPDTKNQRKIISEILPALKKLEIKIFWIKSEQEISIT